MQTSPILNPGNALPVAAPSQNPNGAQSPGPAFNQVLKQEMRRDASHETNREMPRQADGRHTDTGAAGRQQAADPASGKLARPGGKADKGAAQEASLSRDARDNATTASAEMLALVGSLSQLPLEARESGAAAQDRPPPEELPIDALLTEPPAGAGPSVIAPHAGLPVPGAPGADKPGRDPSATTTAVAEGADAAPGTGRRYGLAGETGTQQGKSDAASTPADTTASPSVAGAARPDNAPAAGNGAGKFAQHLQHTVSETTTPAIEAQAAASPAGQAQALTHSAVAQHGNAALERLTPQVGSPAWNQALGQKVVWMVAGEQQSATLTLNPPDLGPLEVVVNVSNAHASATFTAAQPEVRQALEAALPRLRDMLAEAGIQLGQASVSAGTPHQHQGDGHPSSAMHGNERGTRAELADTGAAPVPIRAIAAARGLVDTFA